MDLCHRATLRCREFGRRGDRLGEDGLRRRIGRVHHLYEARPAVQIFCGQIQCSCQCLDHSLGRRPEPAFYL